MNTYFMHFFYLLQLKCNEYLSGQRDENITKIAMLSNGQFPTFQLNLFRNNNFSLLPGLKEGAHRITARHAFN